MERAASALRSAGVKPGDRVLVTSRNTADHLFVWLALMEVGAIQVPVNPQGTDAELAGFVEQVRPALIVADDPLASTAAPPRRCTRAVLRGRRSVEDRLRSSPTTSR